MLPALDRLSLSRTGEFYPLSQNEVDQLNKDGEQEPFSTEPYQKDVNQDAWHTFRVRSTKPSADGTYKYRYYRAESLWRWHKDNSNDPITREPIWYEDWWALHDAYDMEGVVPSWVYTLPTRGPNTIVVRPVQAPPQAAQSPPGPIPMPGMTRTFDNRGNGREWAFAESSGDEDDASGMPPGTPTPIPVHRQPNQPQLSDEDRESERLFAVRNRARERFDRLLRLDEPSPPNVLRNAMRDVELAGEAIQEFLDRLAADENDPNGLRASQAGSERYGRREAAERMQRQVDQAVARWAERRSATRAADVVNNAFGPPPSDADRQAAADAVNNAFGPPPSDADRQAAADAVNNAFGPLPGAPLPVRQNATPLSEEAMRDRERLFREFEERERLRLQREGGN